MKSFALAICILLFFATNASIANSKSIMTRKKAITLVRQLPEVHEYLLNVPKGHIDYSHETESKDAWVIQVYEIKDKHTTTFNWFIVDKKTGKITKEFNF